MSLLFILFILALGIVTVLVTHRFGLAAGIAIVLVGVCILLWPRVMGR